ncbi:hypothetical protein [Botrimarina mediterranea]|uniref:PEP-CTERM protein-sorting domain-containing protein n=1 Tax=Botrimarina mediterranea TaxID=2528022 RepID=A0A518K5G7_9BACT|nr:hypothetical protein [Botrimarina mediterranea]QDV73039.1 hypothetical protein Spa11_12270 [Botrimarina mediterranea]QDV77612.1 hypothetical protein K2D_12090 [Planctomycetes bacterium K2D]
MNASIPATFRLPAAVGALAFAGLLAMPAATCAAPFTVIDGEGFEAPNYSTTFLGSGQLEGQFASIDGGFGSTQWKRSPNTGAGTAVVQDSVVASGSQAVRVDRAAGSDDRWAVPVTGYPAERYVCIGWDMLVEPTVSAGFGPFFGVEAYDDATSLIRMGMLGVDASTGEVLYGDAVDALQPTPGGETVAFGSWNSFHIQLDFLTQTYSGYVNGALVIDTDFEFPGAAQFTDADIAALAAAGDAISQSLTGTAYFDNYHVTESDAPCFIPEPSAMMAGLVGIAVLAVRCRV